MKLAVPHLGESVAPCFEYSSTVLVYTIENGKVLEKTDFPLHSEEPFDRIRLLRDLKIDVIICGGLREKFEDLLKASGIRVISWVSGPVEELLDLFLKGRLGSGKRHDRAHHGSDNMAARKEDER